MQAFLDLQKAFDTVHHNIIKKLEHYRIRQVSNIWFKSYLTNRKKHTYYGGIIWDVKLIEYWVSQGSVLGPLLFRFIIDLHRAIEKSSVHHFANDTNLLNKSLKKINKYFNRDSKCTVDWFRANKYPLIPGKQK